jgi:hypothetical protein
MSTNLFPQNNNDNDWKTWKAGGSQSWGPNPITGYGGLDLMPFDLYTRDNVEKERKEHYDKYYFEYEKENDPSHLLTFQQEQEIYKAREGKTKSPYKKEYEFEDYLSRKYYDRPLVPPAGPEPIYNQPSRTLPDYVDQSPPSYNNERTWQDTSETWKTTGNILGTAGGVYSYFDPATGALISGVGAGFTGVGNVIDYLTSP